MEFKYVCKFKEMKLKFFYRGGVEPRPLLLRSLNALLYQPPADDGDDDDDECGTIGGIIARGSRSTRKNRPIAALCTTNAT
jgi:hypothetical protein